MLESSQLSHPMCCPSICSSIDVQDTTTQDIILKRPYLAPVAFVAIADQDQTALIGLTLYQTTIVWT